MLIFFCDYDALPQANTAPENGWLEQYFPFGMPISSCHVRQFSMSFLYPEATPVATGVLPLALGSENSAAVNWLQAQFAGRLVQKESDIFCEFVDFFEPVE